MEWMREREREHPSFHALFLGGGGGGGGGGIGGGWGAYLKLSPSFIVFHYPFVAEPRPTTNTFWTNFDFPLMIVFSM